MGKTAPIEIAAIDSVGGNNYAKKDTWELNAEGWKLLNSEFV